MKSVDERKRRLISQIGHLKREVDKLVQPGERNRAVPTISQAGARLCLWCSWASSIPS